MIRGAPSAFIRPISLGAFEHRGACRGRHGQRRGEQSPKGHQPHQRAHPRQNAPFAFRDLADRPHLHAGQLFLHLTRDRGNIRRAIPTLEFHRRHGVRVPLRKRVLGFGQRAHQQAAILPGAIRELLRDGERRQHGIVLLAARRSDADDAKLHGAIAGAQLQRLADGNVRSPRQRRAHDALCRVIAKPAPIHVPPGTGGRNSRGECASALGDRSHRDGTRCR